MRLLTWNINGIRTLPQYHPWNTLKSGDGILNELGADIICFQEVKSTRQTIDKSVALPESYDAFFSFPAIKGGYSGVSVCTKSSRVVPLKAEEGISGRLQSGLKPPLSAEERISQVIPDAHEMVLLEDEASKTHMDLIELDKEGRALMLDFGLFVLINVYCPNETSDARLPYKMNFHLLLQERVRLLTEVDKREVIVVGDINVCAAPIDHCDGELPSNKEEFWVHPARKWFHEWLHPIGPMYDIVRNCWPERKGMYTCWNQKIDARTTNYGTRIDYFLLTKGLLPWFKHGDIQAHVKGSDHCPVYIDLHDQITDEGGDTLYLKDMLKMNGEKRDPPRLATKFWVEYSGKQQVLSSFFGKKAATASESDLAIASTVSIRPASGKSSTVASTPATTDSGKTREIESREISKADESKSYNQEAIFPPPVPEEKIARSSTSSNLTIISSTNDPHSNGSLSSATVAAEAAPPLKRKKMQADSNYPAQAPKKSKKGNSAPKLKGKESTTAQMKLSSFFSGPTSSQSQADVDDKEEESPIRSQKSEVIDVDALLNDSDALTVQSEVQLSPPVTVPGSSRTEKGNNSHTWSTLFARIEPPKCVVHGEACREFTVNKPGPNKGKAFFICARPVGPGYDAGKDRRLREEVNSQYRCNFFKWSSEVKREALREADKRNGKS
ncbi:DNase I-like protein [Fomitiporia mediterranea MF3/22]|uniref:DNase I-like protein n=1 Tax=Fomitiporia mediterranea (strain MF3/22) TaxID=694068 RepID=UPI00044093D4|nr:DNase I-like protein [Fomitiporia mediterranea MF3/22]EJD07362.1 DNase I-like protein [Fomitiporia mediterranea MF3/22]